MSRQACRLFLTLILTVFSAAHLEAQQTIEQLTLVQANRLAQLPLDCVVTEYPNKTGQTLNSAADLGGPRTLHPAFFGCFDWHSAVHGHWSLVKLLKLYPQLATAVEARDLLARNLSPENIQGELTYFQRQQEGSYERTYGWAWLLKLVEELHSWDDPLARRLEQNLQPLTDLLVSRYLDYLPRLHYPIRVGEHTNSAFGAAFAWDYAVALDNKELQTALATRARDFFLPDSNCPLAYEPSGYDFLSPCLEEVDLMRRVLSAADFFTWLDQFMPGLSRPGFALAPGEVSDRSDGHLVHLDGLNFSRAWVLYGLVAQFPQFAHLRAVADAHIAYSLPNLVGDGYEGGHWLASFAIYALDQQ